MYWIPSHVGILGNEMADQLASKERNLFHPSRVLNNTLSTAEQVTVFKEYLNKKKHQRTASRKRKRQHSHENKNRDAEWHIHKYRSITRILFRLRSGHNRLKANLARFTSQINNSCQYCEEDEETTKHILLECPALELEREGINKYFTTNKM